MADSCLLTSEIRFVGIVEIVEIVESVEISV